MHKVLVTGCAGLIGSHFSKYLLDRGYEVYGIDNLSGGYKEFIDPRVGFNQIDLDIPFAVQHAFEKVKPNYVYHFAAYAAEGLSPFIRNFNYTNNLITSANVINECVKHNVKKIIFTSSMAVYGHGEPPFMEEDPPEPADPYGIAKYAVELDLKQAYEQFGLKYSIVRPHNVIGTNQNIWDRYRNVIGIWIRQILKGQDITIFGDGLQTRAFSDIKFCLEPLEKLMRQGDGEIYNIGSDTEYTLLEAAKILQEIGKENGFNPKIVHLPARKEVKHAYSDHSKAKEELGFYDLTDLKFTAKEMFEWAKSQPDRQIKTMPYEIDKNMYDFWR